MQQVHDAHDQWIFVGQMVSVFVVTLILLGFFGLLPKALQPDFASSATERINEAPELPILDTTPAVAQTFTKPTHIQIPEVGIDINIMHPDSPRIDILDEALKQGAVYYPGSGSIEDGTIFLFGHSSNWAVVRNQAYKAFSGVDKLSAGSLIYLTANNRLYVYEVERVSHVDVNTALIDLSKDGRRLVMSTCDTFGAKTDRWVVEAIFKEVQG